MDANGIAYNIEEIQDYYSLQITTQAAVPEVLQQVRRSYAHYRGRYVFRQ